MRNKIVLEKILREFSEKLPKFPDGRIDYSGSGRAPVLNCFVKYEDKILLFKRSNKVRAYKGLWNTVAGYLDDFHPLEEKARAELQEEIGITADFIEQIKIGAPYEFKDKNIEKTWIIFPVVAELNKKPVIKLDWEHTEYQWINPTDLKKFDIIPSLEKTLARVIDSGENKKILFISGSPRKGNTEHILSKIYESVDSNSKELILLKDRNIKFCKGCLTCYTKSGCVIKDDMEALRAKISNSDILVLGTPNYYENVSGLMKNFIDRCHPFYEHKLVRNKKIILIYVGGGGKKGTKKCLDLAFYGFIKHLKLNLIGSYSFQALEWNELSKKDISKEIAKIVKKINSC